MYSYLQLRKSLFSMLKFFSIFTFVLLGSKFIFINSSPIGSSSMLPQDIFKVIYPSYSIKSKIQILLTLFDVAFKFFSAKFIPFGSTKSEIMNFSTLFWLVLF